MTLIWHDPRDEDPRDPPAPARGIVSGLLISLIWWALVCLAIAWALP